LALSAVKIREEILAGNEHMINYYQIKTIYRMTREGGLSEGDLRRLISGLTGKGALRDLTSVEASQIITVLVKGGDSHPETGTSQLNLVRLATDEQLRTIGGLLRKLGYGLREPYFLARLKNLTGHSRIRRWAEAEVAIQILEEILARRLGESTAQEPESDGRGRAA
jgi:hypothetical protein